MGGGSATGPNDYWSSQTLDPLGLLLGASTLGPINQPFSGFNGPPPQAPVIPQQFADIPGAYWKFGSGVPQSKNKFFHNVPLGPAKMQ